MALQRQRSFVAKGAYASHASYASHACASEDLVYVNRHQPFLSDITHTSLGYVLPMGYVALWGPTGEGRRFGAMVALPELIRVRGCLFLVVAALSGAVDLVVGASARNKGNGASLAGEGTIPH